MAVDDKMLNDVFSEDEIQVFLKRKQDYIEGKTTARDWREIEEELNQQYDLK